MIKFIRNLALFWVKNANFSAIFLRKYLKNHNIDPWCASVALILWYTTTVQGC
jgi:hypothetical protein